jgi:spore germination protein GerM
VKPVKPHRSASVPLVLLTAVWLLLSGVAPAGAAQAVPRVSGEPDEARPAAESVAHLYFVDSQGLLLTSEPRVMPRQADAWQRAQWLVAELTRGPRQGGLPALPPQTELRALFITPDETATVDFSAAVREHHPAGVRSELLSVYAVVNTLILNLPEVSAVRILIEGREASTLAGHVALTAPLTADMLMIR